MCLCKVSCVKISLIISTALVIACGIAAVVLGFVGKDASVYGMVESFVPSVPVGQYVFIALLSLGGLCLLLGLCGICTATKKPMICFILFMIFSTLVWVIFIALGGGMLYVTMNMITTAEIVS